MELKSSSKTNCKVSQGDLITLLFLRDYWFVLSFLPFPVWEPDQFKIRKHLKNITLWRDFLFFLFPYILKLFSLECAPEDCQVAGPQALFWGILLLEAWSFTTWTVNSGKLWFSLSVSWLSTICFQPFWGAFGSPELWDSPPAHGMLWGEVSLLLVLCWSHPGSSHPRNRTFFFVIIFVFISSGFLRLFWLVSVH